MQRIGRRAFLRRLIGAGAFGGVLLGSSEVAYLLRQATWQRAGRTRLVLTGTVVTFQPETSVIERGAIYLDEQGHIAAVQPMQAPAPSGYGTVPRVETGGMIYPGLIDLHNHPYYDLHGLWTPQRTTPYTSRSQWRAEATLEEDIESPQSLIEVSWQYTKEAALKYVEMKALVGGVTTLQGLGLTSPPREGWLVRHVETEQRHGVPVAADFVFLPEVPDPYALFRQTMAQGTAVIYHLAEGSDPALRSDFEALYQQGCLGPRFIGVPPLGIRVRGYGHIPYVSKGQVSCSFKRPTMFPDKCLQTHWLLTRDAQTQEFKIILPRAGPLACALPAAVSNSRKASRGAARRSTPWRVLWLRSEAAIRHLSPGHTLCSSHIQAPDVAKDCAAQRPQRPARQGRWHQYQRRLQL